MTSNRIAARLGYMTYLLAGDIGGTKTLLRLVEVDSSQQLLNRAETSYPSQEYPDLVPIGQQFLGEAGAKLGTEIRVESACFAIAGAVVNGASSLPNLGWELTVDRLQQQLQIPRIELINDFAAVGYGIFRLTAEDLHTLQVGNPQPQAPKAVIGAGTGLGEGFLIHDGTNYRVIATEGGHTDFAARSAQEYALVEYVCKQKQIDRVSNDRLISGQGIVAMYQFLRDRNFAPENPELATLMRNWENDPESNIAPTALISSHAQNKTDPLSQETMRMFISAYGAEAGNLALKILPYGGLYIAGGIAAKNLPLMEDGTFLNAFNDKGRVSPLLANIPVYLILNPQVGLIGAVGRALEIEN
jgi:glucokinase